MDILGILFKTVEIPVEKYITEGYWSTALTANDVNLCFRGLTLGNCNKWDIASHLLQIKQSLLWIIYEWQNTASN